MSQWTCKIGAEEIGPLSFQELAALAREGKLTETTFDLFALTTYAAWRASARFFRREDSA